MSSVRSGHFSADIHTASGLESFRMMVGLRHYLRKGVHSIEAVNDKGEGFYVYLPDDIKTGTYQLEIGLPSIIHVTDCSEAELYPVGSLTLTVGGGGQFSGTFSGTDADGIQIANGSFRLERQA
ncbi:hypothetical protein [Pseudomonas sp. RA_35y_Pfl2_P32]|uniref:hypothetical protein n=1 Tax=Pseudomonas sp. RA_35y_Pfl2_P32 TaxID=3088705 RepID=UPI0030D71395